MWREAGLKHPVLVQVLEEEEEAAEAVEGYQPP